MDDLPKDNRNELKSFSEATNLYIYRQIFSKFVFNLTIF